MGDIILLPLMALPILGMLIAVTVIASWRWGVGLLAIGSAGILTLWIRYWSVSTAPGYREGIDTSLAVAFIGMWSAAFVFAAFAYAVGLIWWYEID